MLIISLASSALLLLVANALMLARMPRGAGARLACSALACTAVAIPLVFGLAAMALQGLLLCGAVAICRWARGGPPTFFGLSCGATLLAYLQFGVLMAQPEQGYARLRAVHPRESMEMRRPVSAPMLADAAPLAEGLRRLDPPEGAIPDQPRDYRERQLMRLHERAVELFVDSPGFGVERVFHLREQDTDPARPGSRSAPEWSPGASPRLAVADEAPPGRLLDLANPAGFGDSFKDRWHVAGFEPHRSGRVPDAASQWEVESIELMGLVVHHEPAVYTSARLPRMHELAEIPTRPPDGFEQLGLLALRRGEDIVTAEVDGGMRMLGAIRATGSCLGCHGDKRGELLGAFSYALRPAGSPLGLALTLP